MSLRLFRFRLLRLTFFKKTTTEPFRSYKSSLLVVSSNCLQTTRTMSATKKPFERLPTNVLPKNYNLTLQPNLTEFTFTGKEVIDVEVRVLFNWKQIKQVLENFVAFEDEMNFSALTRKRYAILKTWKNHIEGLQQGTKKLTPFHSTHFCVNQCFNCQLLHGK